MAKHFKGRDRRGDSTRGRKHSGGQPHGVLRRRSRSCDLLQDRVRHYQPRSGKTAYVIIWFADADGNMIEIEHVTPAQSLRRRGPTSTRRRKVPNTRVSTSLSVTRTQPRLPPPGEARHQVAQPRPRHSIATAQRRWS